MHVKVKLLRKVYVYVCTGSNQAYVLISFLCTLTRLSMNELFDVTPLVACSGSRPYNAR